MALLKDRRVFMIFAMLFAMQFAVTCRPVASSGVKDNDDPQGAAAPAASPPAADDNNQTCAVPVGTSTDSGASLGLDDPVISAAPPPQNRVDCSRGYQAEVDGCGFADASITWNRGACAGVNAANRGVLAGVIVAGTGAIVDNPGMVINGLRTAGSQFVQGGCSADACTACLNAAATRYQACIDTVDAQNASDGSIACGSYVPAQTTNSADRSNFTSQPFVQQTTACSSRYPKCCQNDAYVPLHPNTAYCYSNTRAAPLTCAP